MYNNNKLLVFATMATQKQDFVQVTVSKQSSSVKLPDAEFSLRHSVLLQRHFSNTSCSQVMER